MCNTYRRTHYCTCTRCEKCCQRERMNSRGTPRTRLRSTSLCICLHHMLCTGLCVYDGAARARHAIAGMHCQNTTAHGRALSPCFEGLIPFQQRSDSRGCGPLHRLPLTSPPAVHPYSKPAHSDGYWQGRRSMFVPKPNGACHGVAARQVRSAAVPPGGPVKPTSHRQLVAASSAAPVGTLAFAGHATHAAAHNKAMSGFPAA